MEMAFDFHFAGFTRAGLDRLDKGIHGHSSILHPLKAVVAQFGDGSATA